MVMGAGKTTVITSLLVMLANGNSHVTQLMPHALLESSRGATREKYATVVRKPAFTFSFDHSMPRTYELYLKLCKPRDSKAVVCATPTGVKSLMLRLIEMMRQLTEKIFARHKKGGGGFLSAFSLSHLAKCFRDHFVRSINESEIRRGVLLC